MLSYISTILFGALFVVVPALADTTPMEGAPPATSAFAEQPAPTNGALLDVGQYARVSSYNSVNGWDGMGDQQWFFPFDATYTSEAFAVTLWATTTETLSNYGWTTAAPTATLSCNLHVTASPTLRVEVVLADRTPYVPEPTNLGFTLDCAPTSA